MSGDSVKNYFQDQFAAEVGQHQENKAADSPAYSGTSAPAEAPAPPEQDSKHQPGTDGQHGLVDEMLGEDIFQKKYSGKQGQGQQGEADADHFEHQAFHGLQRWQRANETAGLLVVQVAFLHGEQQRLQYGKAEDAVGQQG